LLVCYATARGQKRQKNIVPLAEEYLIESCRVGGGRGSWNIRIRFAPRPESVSLLKRLVDALAMLAFRVLVVGPRLSQLGKSEVGDAARPNSRMKAIPRQSSPEEARLLLSSDANYVEG